MGELGSALGGWAGGRAVGLPGPVPPVVDIVAGCTSCGWDTQVHGGEATVRSVQHHLDASGARLRARPAAVRIAGGTRRRTRRFSRRLASVLAAPYRPPSPPFGPFRPHLASPRAKGAPAHPECSPAASGGTIGQPQCEDYPRTNNRP